MSDSDSSSSSATGSLRGGSPKPDVVTAAESTQVTEQQHELSTTAVNADQSGKSIDVKESTSDDHANGVDESERNTEETEPDPDAAPLHISWNDKRDIGSQIPVDFVVVHGVYGTWENGTQSGPGSGSTNWVDIYKENMDDRCRVLRFEYEPLQLFSGRRSRESIHNTSLKLLRALSAVRKNESQKRIIVFIAHDIGGIVVKDALATAALERTTWLDIFEMSRILVFQGCPHRSTDNLDMEDRLSCFLFSDHAADQPKVRPSVASICGLAAATMEVNGLFVESKIPLRSSIVSVYGHNDYFNHALDKYCGTMGIPLERRIETIYDYSPVTDHLQTLLSILSTRIDSELLHHERQIVSLASPVYPLQYGQSVNFIADSEQFKAWMAHAGPQILYVHGKNRVREAAEQVFYDLTDRALTDKKRTLVLYFSFDRHDVRCDSLRDMLSTFLAQIICHYPRLSDRIRFAFARFRLERGWTESDLVYWFERFRFTDEFEQVMFVINYFDECTKGSQKLFLDNFAYFSRASEAPWKVVITSHKPGALLNELRSPWCVNLDLTAADLDTINTTSFDEEILRLIKIRPELHLQDTLVRDELKQLEKFDPLARHIFWEQTILREDWPSEMSVKEIFSSFDLASTPSSVNELLEQLMQWVLERVPEKDTLQRLLTWLLYAVRPLTIWEFATVIYTGSGQDQGDIVPSPAIVTSTVEKITTWLAGIIDIEHNEIRIHHPHLRNILMGKLKDQGSSETPKFLWEAIKPTAHFDIARLCLEYLSRPLVHDLIDKTFQVEDLETLESPTCNDRGNLVSYSLQAWTHHFLLSTPRPELSKLLSQSSSNNLAQSLARGYWILSNPVTRNAVCLESLFPIFAGLGLLDVVDPLDEADTRRGLLEAAAKGQVTTVQHLLTKVENSESTLMDTLLAAGASGIQDVMLDLIDRLVAYHEDPKSIDWPPVLLHRASWIGLDRVADRILDLGCSPDIDIEWSSIVKATPLSSAARNYHVETVRTLLRHNADVNSRHLYNRTVLHHVAGTGHAEIARILVEEGKVDMETTDEDDLTTLYFGCLWGHHHAVEVLLDLGADPDMGIKPDTTGKWSPLVVAVDDGYKHAVKLLLDKKANPNIGGPSEIGTPLRYAAVKGHVEICQMLIDSGADPNSSMIYPPILIQVINDFEGNDNQLDIIDLLISHNADVNAKDSTGTSVLAHAVKSDQSEVLARRLLNHGADPNILDSSDFGPLYWAAENKELSVVELLLEKNANVNQLSSSHLTPLYFAIPHSEKSRVLLEHGADPDLSVNSGFTTLMYAAWYSHYDSVEHLLKHNASLELQYSGDDDALKGWTAFACAASYGSNEVVRLLAEHGADLRHVTADGTPVIHLAAAADNLSVMMEFPLKIDIHQKNSTGGSMLHIANVSLANVKRLVNAGLDINARDAAALDTPVSMAAVNNDLDRVKYLLKCGADINLGSPSDGPALHQACLRGRFEIAKLLVESGADINTAADGIVGTPLQAACLRYGGNENDSHEEIVEYLLANGADITAEGGLVGNVIAAAAYASSPSMLKSLIDRGGKVDAVDGIGRMPIHAAAFHGFDNFQVILDAGGDIKARDETGRTALHWAAQPARLRVVEKLIALLPDKDAINDPDIDGWTPLCWAARGTDCWLSHDQEGEPPEQIKVIKLLLENGADRTVVAAIGGQKWSPVKIARFSGQSDEVINLLKHGLAAESEEGEKREGDLEDEADEHKSKVGNLRPPTCDICRCIIRGFIYHCKTCIDFDVCLKCYPHRQILHATDHSFDQNGPEFEDTSEDDADDASSETTASSDSDSD